MTRKCIFNAVGAISISLLMSVNCVALSGSLTNDHMKRGASQGDSISGEMDADVGMLQLKLKPEKVGLPLDFTVTHNLHINDNLKIISGIQLDDFIPSTSNDFTMKNAMIDRANLGMVIYGEAGMLEGHVSFPFAGSQEGAISGEIQARLPLGLNLKLKPEKAGLPFDFTVTHNLDINDNLNIISSIQLDDFIPTTLNDFTMKNAMVDKAFLRINYAHGDSYFSGHVSVPLGTGAQDDPDEKESNRKPHAELSYKKYFEGLLPFLNAVNLKIGIVPGDYIYWNVGLDAAHEGLLYEIKFHDNKSFEGFDCEEIDACDSRVTHSLSVQ